MLRRLQPSAADLEAADTTSSRAEGARPSLLRRDLTQVVRESTFEGSSDSAVGAMHERIERAFTPQSETPVEVFEAEQEQPPRPQQSQVPRPERPRLETLRSDLRWTISDDPRPRTGVLAGMAGRSRVRFMQVLLVAVALVAGGYAAFLALQRSEPAPVVEPQVEIVVEPVREPLAQVLVASRSISVGHRLTADAVEWVDWPEAALRPELITAGTSPDAMADIVDSVARAEFFPGEPISQQKIVELGSGYLSAMLAEGMRGVSVSIAAESASGGFILPDDHVDVVVTRPTASGQASETILSNVRVLAIDSRLGPQPTAEAELPNGPEVFTGPAIATLELDPVQAEVVIAASAVGQLSLVLRSILDVTQAGARAPSANDGVRISSPFWSQ